MKLESSWKDFKGIYFRGEGLMNLSCHFCVALTDCIAVVIKDWDKTSSIDLLKSPMRDIGCSKIKHNVVYTSSYPLQW